MAITISELNSVSKKYYDGKIKQQVYEESPFFRRLMKKGKVVTDGGESLQWPVRYQKYSLSQASGPRDELTYVGKDTRTAAVDEWKYYTTQATMHLDEKVKNQGVGRIVDLLKEKAKEMKEDFQDLLYTDLFSTTAYTSTGHPICPLNTIIDSTTSYGGIAYTDAAEWAATESAATTLVLTGTNSLSYMVNQATFGTNKPSVHITTRDLASKLEGLLQPQVRYEPKNDLDYGADVFFKGAPVYGDAFCTSTYWYGIDEEQFEFRVMKGCDMVIDDWSDLKQRGFPWAVAKTGLWVGNLICRMRKTSFKYTSLVYSN